MVRDAQEAPSRVFPPDGTAARLLDAAAALFRAKGYAGTSTRELAAALGVQNASLYHHIAKKEDLLYTLSAQALGRIQREVERAVGEVADPDERLRALIRAHLGAALADQNKHATMLLELRSLSDARRAEILRMRDAYERLVRTAIADAQDAGVLRRDIKPRFLTFALLNLLNWSIFWYRPTGELGPEQLADLFASLFLEGVTTRRAGADAANGRAGRPRRASARAAKAKRSR